jgi:hypothetical protein
MRQSTANVSKLASESIDRTEETELLRSLEYSLGVQILSAKEASRHRLRGELEKKEELAS